MDKLSLQQIRDVIWELPVADRTALLAMSVIDKRGAPVDGVLALIDLVSRMGSLLSTDRRFRVSERARSVADKLELTAPVFTDGGTR